MRVQQNKRSESLGSMLDAGSMLTVPLHRERQVCRTKEHDFEVLCSWRSFELRSLEYIQSFTLTEENLKTLGQRMF